VSEYIRAIPEVSNPSWLAAATPAGFWRRVAARLNDMAILLPLTLTLVLATGSSRELSIVADLFGLFITQAYVVISLYLWCQTAGKMIMGVRVVSIDGDRLTLTQAMLRSSIEAGFAALIVAFTAIAKFSITQSTFASLGIVERARLIADAAPQLRVINLLNGLWFLASGVILVYTTYKRAPHDFIASTRVVRIEPGNDEVESGDSGAAVR
jgi:uncharacterized RDD family membrane protein YckC